MSGGISRFFSASSKTVAIVPYVVSRKTVTLMCIRQPFSKDVSWVSLCVPRIFFLCVWKNNYLPHLEWTSIPLSCSFASFKFQYTSICGGKEDCAVNKTFWKPLTGQHRNNHFWTWTFMRIFLVHSGLQSEGSFCCLYETGFRPTIQTSE